MVIENKSEIGNIVLENKVFKDIAEISALKVSGIYPNKKNDFAEVKLKDDQFSVVLNVKLKQNIDIVKTCSKAQMRVREALEDMTGIPVASVNVEIQGFVKEKETKANKEKEVKEGTEQ
ncbi:MAG: Asp23/Gls24 family envelope stress response protein [Erysipelotrichaceae bacterium]|nr:Asp23/Gls24 family envelope stress response protein [Erysipelotrichaceae bacterium]